MTGSLVKAKLHGLSRAGEVAELEQRLTNMEMHAGQEMDKFCGSQRVSQGFLVATESKFRFGQAVVRDGEVVVTIKHPFEDSSGILETTGEQMQLAKPDMDPGRI